MTQNDPYQVARDFCISLENDPAARKEFIRQNYQDAVWLSVDENSFFDYGIPIPGGEAGGLLLAEVIHIFGGWFVHYLGALTDPPAPYPDAAEAKAAVALAIREMYNMSYVSFQGAPACSPPAYHYLSSMEIASQVGQICHLTTADLGKTITFDPDANEFHIELAADVKEGDNADTP